MIRTFRRDGFLLLAVAFSLLSATEFFMGTFSGAAEPKAGNRHNWGDSNNLKKTLIDLDAPYLPSKLLWDSGVDEAVWNELPSVEIPLMEKKSGPKKIVIKAAHDGDFFFLHAEWEDLTRDTAYKPWEWDPSQKTYARGKLADDALAMFIYSEVDSNDPCMLSGGNMLADMWLWRAEWSDISGYAYDGRFMASRNRLPHSNSYAAKDGENMVWLMGEPDQGALPWALHIPVGFFSGSIVQSYKYSNPSGSLKDIRAVGSWSSSPNGRSVWKVQMTRALDTKNSDDVSLEINKEQQIAFAVFDKGDKGDHAASPMIRLVLGAKRR